MTSPFPLDIGLIERFGRPMLRPTLHITYAGPRITEEVGIKYSLPPYGSFQGTGATASVTAGNRTVVGRAKYVRAWVHNIFGFPAHGCQVFLNRILHDGKVIEPERSPLHWTDVDDCYEWPILTNGYKNGHYIDICSTDSVMHQFQIISQKAKKGYHAFIQSGTYRMEMTAEALKPCSFGRFALTIKFDAKNWENLQVVAAEHGKKLLRWR